MLDGLLRELTVVDIHNLTVLDHYARIDAFAKRNGHALSDNDTWIAATCAAADATLLTNDKDFDALDGEHIRRIYVPHQRPTSPE
jgi:predicted nucleic acid-binding protein